MTQLFLAALKVELDGIPRVVFDDNAIANVLSVALIVAGAFSVLFIILGAVRYAISAGDSGHLTAARNTILYALIGLVISMSAFAVVQFVLSRF
jgi:hypothetical protein